VLKELHLGSLAEQAGGLDTEHDWTAMTAMNEQAMLVLARVLLAMPDYVFLDRMSIALDAKQADQVLRLLTDRKITYIMMGKPGDPLTNFDATLDIHANGTWIWRSQAEARKEAATREAG
jgi:putative ATP-binding cassette transporter